MHIVFWSPGWPLEKFHNGIVTYVHWMRRELERQGHRVSVFTNDLDPMSADPGVHKVKKSFGQRLSSRLARSKGYSEHALFGMSSDIASAINRLHRRVPVDIVEIEESFGWCAEIARLTSLPVVVKLHGPAFLSMLGEELDTSFGREKVKREGLSLRACPAISSPCASTLQQTIERYNLHPVLCRHIVNPLAIEDDLPLWNLDACDRNLILFVGRFDSRKGGDTILKAFSLLLASRPTSKLIFVGPDLGVVQPDGNRIQFDTLRDFLFPPELKSRVDFRGRLPNRAIAKLRCQAMATVVASRWENQGYALLEAMLQGCPVVSSDAGGCRESVADGQTGLLAQAEDPAAYADRLRVLLDNPERAAELGKAARQFVLREHSATKVVADSISFYSLAIALHGNRTSNLVI